MKWDQFEKFKREAPLTVSDCMCWNHMTPLQQDTLRTTGIIWKGYYNGGPCNNKAEVAIQIGNDCGPRFYCKECADRIKSKIIPEIPA